MSGDIVIKIQDTALDLKVFTQKWIKKVKGQFINVVSFFCETK